MILPGQCMLPGEMGTQFCVKVIQCLEAQSKLKHSTASRWWTPQWKEGISDAQASH